MMEDGDIPVIRTRVGPGMINSDGEISAPVFSTYTALTGAEEEFEAGRFYGLVSGTGVDMELAGVLVVEAEDQRWDGVTVRETGGIIAYR